MSSSAFLIVRLGSLGDIIHGLPVAAALRSAFPDARIDWLVDARHDALLQLVPAIDRRVVVSASTGGFLRALRALRTREYDVALDLQGLWKSAALARGSGARRVIGFARPHLREPGARLFYSETEARVSGPHVVRKNLSLLRAVGLDPTGLAVTFPLAVPASPVVDEVRRQLQLGPDDRFALLNPGAAWPNKRWPPERFGRVAATLATRHGLRSAVLWGPGEEPLAETVAETSEGAAVAAPATRIADLLALARAARLMVSGDTGPMHVAAAVGTPVVALFGPTDEARNGPWNDDDVSVSQHAACSCRYQRRCRRARPCLRDIGVEEALRAIDRRLGGREQRAAGIT